MLLKLYTAEFAAACAFNLQRNVQLLASARIYTYARSQRSHAPFVYTIQALISANVILVSVNFKNPKSKYSPGR